MHKIFVYNFDGTIYNGNSSVDFLLFYLKRRFKNIIYLPLILFFSFLYVLKIISAEKYKEKIFSCLKKEKNIKKIVNEFWESYNKKINTFILNDFYDEQRDIYVVSSSFDFILDEYFKNFSNITLICTKYDIKAKRIIGKVCQGKEKLKKLMLLNEKNSIEEFYSNSLNDINIIQKLKKAFWIKKNKKHLWSNKDINDKKNKKVAFTLFLLFFIFYLIIGIFVSYNYDFKDNFNLLFDSDTSRVIGDFSNIFGNHYRIRVHPLYIILVQPIILLLNGVTMDSMLSLIIFSSFVTAVSVTFLYLIGSMFTNNSKIKIIVSLIFGFAFTNFIFTIGIEVYNIAMLFLILLWYHTIKLFKKEVITKKDNLILLLLGVSSIAFTVTNYFIFLIISLILLLSKKIKFTKLLKINVLVIVLTVILSFFQNIVWNNTTIIYEFNDNFSEEQNYINFDLNFNKVKEVIKNGYMNSLVSSDITLEYHKNDGNVLTFDETSIITIVVFCILYGIILYFLIKNFKKNIWLNIGIILALCFNTCLHLFYGTNTFLYSCHFLYLPFMLFFINYNDFKGKKIQKILFSALIIIFAGEFIINLYHLKDVITYVGSLLPHNYFRVNLNSFELLVLIFMLVLIGVILIYLIYKNIRKIKKDNLFYPILACVTCLMLLQCIFIAIQTAPHYGKFLGITLSKVNEQESIMSTKNIDKNLETNFKQEYNSYLNYLKEYNDFAGNYPVEFVDIGESDYYFFGMGNRKKLLYKDGEIIDIFNNKILFKWNVKDYLIIPNEYSVILYTKNGKNIKIYEDKHGVFIEENGEKRIIEGTDFYINLEDFKNQKYQNMKKVLYNEILFNIKDSTPYPNILVYEKAWYRDGAMVAMVLKHTDNVELIEEWISSINSIYDMQNDGTKEPDNLGELLYIISVSENSHKDLIQKIIIEAEKIADNNADGYYLEGMTDGASHPIYQTKWYNFGLKSLNVKNSLSIVDNKDNYDALTWWNGKNSNTYFPELLSANYPYLSLAQYHKSGKGKIYLNKNIYPLSYEKQGSEANYKNMDILNNYYVTNKISPLHTWSASEMLLFLLDETGNFMK